MKRILFIKSNECSFINNDISILESRFQVNVYKIYTKIKWRYFLLLIKEFFWLLLNQFKYAVIYTWFSDYHILLPLILSRVFGNKVIIIAGGYDVDELLINKYRTFPAKIRKLISGFCLRKCDFVITVSEHLKNIIKKRNIRKQVEVIYSSVDCSVFKLYPDKKKNIILIVGGSNSLKEMYRKNLSFFVDIGVEFNKKYPFFDAKFIIAGHDHSSPTFNYLTTYINNRDKNIIVLPRTSFQELLALYREASIYMQLSEFEGFGLAQAEAMACGCIPVSHDGGAIREVVANCGFIVPDYNIDSYIEKIKEIIELREEKYRNLASKRIINNYNLNKRKTSLIELINSLITQPL